MYEVEQKHRVDDVDSFVALLKQRGVEIGAAIEQSDEYFEHPARDFAKTDEALRIRTVGDKNFVTYKGPKIDTKTKTRRELEMPLGVAEGDGKKFRQLLELLGFKPVAIVRKIRRPFEIEIEGRHVDRALDDVEGVGTFVELELQSDQAGLDATKQVIASLADDLELGPTERRSYLEMLLQQRS